MKSKLEQDGWSGDLIDEVMRRNKLDSNPSLSFRKHIAVKNQPQVDSFDVPIKPLTPPLAGDPLVNT